MISKQNSAKNKLWQNIIKSYRMDETDCLNHLLKKVSFTEKSQKNIKQNATLWVKKTRERLKKMGSLQAFLQKYDLTSPEGISLMCLAEALLRIPDKYTADKLISDRLSIGNWLSNSQEDDSLFAKAANWSLNIGQKLLGSNADDPKRTFLSKTSSALIRPFIYQAMKKFGDEFVMGTNIENAIERAKSNESLGYRYSYDMLGEAAITKEDAKKYFIAYENAIFTVGKAANNLGPIKGPGISIKLSALHPRYEFAKKEIVFKELLPILESLLITAAKHNIAITLDAEEAHRLEISLQIFAKILENPKLTNWDGLGIAVQAYQKRALPVIEWLAELAKKHKKRIKIRLVKGAYWDSEIKEAQVLGLSSYPVFTRKHATDVSYLACAKRIFELEDYFYPQFATHNAWSVAAIYELANGRKNYEFQCLHGMGKPLYDELIETINCRIYAPVGDHEDLLSYLVRRLLENGANTSFVHLIAQSKLPLDKVLINPLDRIANLESKPHPKIPLPQNIYGTKRQNSTGIDLTDTSSVSNLEKLIQKYAEIKYTAGPIVNGQIQKNKDLIYDIKSPYNPTHIIGQVYHANQVIAKKAIEISHKAKKSWGSTTIATRTKILEKAANLLEENKEKFISLICLEGGRQIADALNEVREAIDFCRYYAMRARNDLITHTLPGPTGELNQLTLHPRGTIACISPLNFPLAIFMGQITAALAAGNTVIAKPANQTPIVATEAVKLLHAAGVETEALQLLPGSGTEIGSLLIQDERINGVMLTGSVTTAQKINRKLAERSGPIVPLIAETGGQNAMIVDSSALPEQVVQDIIVSAFNSAGQRCSALRVLFIQHDIADKVLTMLKNAMQEIKLDNPSLLSTDIGPVIDKSAYEELTKHVADICNSDGKLICQTPENTPKTGWFFRPCVIEINNLAALKQEIFGPILHVIRYESCDIDKVIEQITATGFGLTCGIHSRCESTINYIQKRVPVGNIYVNCNMIGATVGTQPFGGEGLSGTGPKAGGPYYLPRLCVERTVSINTTASGGNASLVSLSDEN